MSLSHSFWYLFKYFILITFGLLASYFWFTLFLKTLSISFTCSYVPYSLFWNTFSFISNSFPSTITFLSFSNSRVCCSFTLYIILLFLLRSQWKICLVFFFSSGHVFLECSYYLQHTLELSITYSRILILYSIFYYIAYSRMLLSIAYFLCKSIIRSFFCCYTNITWFNYDPFCNSLLHRKWRKKCFLEVTTHICVKCPKFMTLSCPFQNSLTLFPNWFLWITLPLLPLFLSYRFHFHHFPL